MSVATKNMNFPTIPVAGAGQTIGGVCNAFIDYTPPSGITIDHWRLTLKDTQIYTNILVNRIKGEFRQLDSAGNKLRGDAFDLTRGNSSTFPLATGVAYVEIYINYIEMYYAGNINLSVDQILTGTGNEVIRIASEDSANNETSAGSILAYRVITTAKLREIVTTTGTPPVRTFNITTTNTNSYIKEWWAEIKAVSGTPQSGDNLQIQLLDERDNVLASNTVGIGVGNRVAVAHNTNAVKVRLTLNTNVQGLSVDVEVSEAIDIAYGT
jgi:hypothetical protein